MLHVFYHGASKILVASRLLFRKLVDLLCQSLDFVFEVSRLSLGLRLFLWLFLLLWLNYHGLGAQPADFKAVGIHQHIGRLNLVPLP